MWPDPSETQELLAQAAAGEEAAAGALMERHRPALRRMVDLRMDRVLQRRLDASDIVQEALLDAHRRLREYLENQKKLPFHLWLRQVAKDRMIDAHRRHRAAGRRSIDREQPAASRSLGDASALDLLAQISDRQLTPCAAATRRELELRFQQALQQLDENDRDVILMRHFEMLSNQETADALGISEPAAGMRYLRAVRRLRLLLEASPLSGSAEPASRTGGAPDSRPRREPPPREGSS